MSIFVDAFVISWSGKHQNANSLAIDLIEDVDRLTVVYSDDSTEDIGGVGYWRRVPDNWFFGRKFKNILEKFDGDVLLIVTADVDCKDWSGVVEGLRSAFAKVPRLGIWSPNVSFTHHTLDRVSVGQVFRPNLHAVIHTDSIVWSLSRSVAERMVEFDYDDNNLGWGVDISAAAYCHAKEMPVVVDTRCEVSHPVGTGYNIKAARGQMLSFFRQMTLREMAHLVFIAPIMKRFAALRGTLFWATRSRRFKKNVERFS